MAALIAGAAVCAVTFLFSYFSPISLLAAAGITAVAALILRYAAAPRETAYRAVSIAVIAFFGLMPVLYVVSSLVHSANSLSIPGSDISPDRATGFIFGQQLGLLRYLFTSILLYAVMAAAGVLMLLGRPGPARVLLFIAMALAAWVHLIPAIRSIGFFFTGLTGTGTTESLIRSLLTFAAELLLLLALIGILPRTAPVETAVSME